MEQKKTACYVIQTPIGESFAGAEFISLKDIAVWTQVRMDSQVNMTARCACTQTGTFCFLLLQSGHVFVHSISALQSTEIVAEQASMELQSLLQANNSSSRPAAMVRGIS